MRINATTVLMHALVKGGQSRVGSAPMCVSHAERQLLSLKRLVLFRPGSFSAPFVGVHTAMMVGIGDGSLVNEQSLRASCALTCFKASLDYCPVKACTQGLSTSRLCPSH